MNIKWIFVIYLVLFFLISDKVYANGVEKQMDVLDFEPVSNELRNSKNDYISNMDVKTLAIKAINGELGLTPGEIINGVLQSLFHEVASLASFMRHMIVIAVLSAIFKNIASSFEKKSVSELGFYVNYVVVVALLISSFSICVQVMNDFVGEICAIMEAATPLLFSVASLSGATVSVFVISPLLLGATSVIAHVVRDYISPLLLIVAALEIINHISEHGMLTKMSELLRKILSWGMRGAAIIFMGIVTLQGMAAPSVDNAAVKTAKMAINAVPVVGAALSSAVDTVFYWTGAVKSGVLVAFLLILIVVCSIPIIKIIAFVFIYRATAAFIQPICDARIVKVIDTTGSFAGLILGTCTIVAALFVFMAIIMLSS